ncbi:MAG: hypothetical protein H6657_19240 [Ardenticatenaceae bacterium]|nr:hypothetical protein [Ardenticatenaceae bacterium]
MNRLEWILGIILVVLLVVVGVLSLTLWFRNDRTAVPNSGPAANSATIIAQRADDIAPTPLYDGRSAIVAYASALKAAQAWQTDAQLMQAQATWPQGSTPDQLLRGEESWGFTFYSPSSQRIGVFSVVEDNACWFQRANTNKLIRCRPVDGIWIVRTQLRFFWPGVGEPFWPNRASLP